LGALIQSDPFQGCVSDRGGAGVLTNSVLVCVLTVDVLGC
jgi:hypothetical protein